MDSGCSIDVFSPLIGDLLLNGGGENSMHTVYMAMPQKLLIIINIIIISLAMTTGCVRARSGGWSVH